MASVTLAVDVVGAAPAVGANAPHTPKSATADSHTRSVRNGARGRGMLV